MAVRKFQLNLCTRESQLGNHVRHGIRNCNKATTTLPAEAMNASIKGGPSKIHSNMSLDKSTKRMIGGINDRLNRRHSKALQEMNSTYYASCAPTNDYVIQEGQGQIDHCFDLRLQCKSTQIAATKWLVWNFDEWCVDKECDQDSDLALHVHVPVFLCVRVLELNKNVGK